jgi:homocysteine S-methyltransferase
VVFAVPHDTVLIADGGLATELEARGHDLSDDLWSARLLLDAPDEIEAVHCAFFRAGASIATTASYQASFDGFAERGMSRDDVARLLRRSVELAKNARDEVGGLGVSAASQGQRWVAASVGPYGAALATGQEYVGRYGLSVAELADWHRPRLEVLADAGADVLALETVPDVDEAEALVSLVHEFGVPAWLSYTIAGTATRAGQPLADAFAVAAEVPEIVAVGVNCCAPDDVEHAIEVASQATGKPVVAYPNSGEQWDGERRTWTGTSGWSAELVPRWAAAGARIIGGCCRVRPDDIAGVAQAIAA